MQAFQKGYVVAILLAIMTIAEYIFAVNFDTEAIRFSGLAATALAKVWLIVTYFMHFMRMFNSEGGH